MSVIDLILLINGCLFIGMIYAYAGYEFTNMLTDSPKWKPWEQCLIWMFWLILIPLYVVAAIMLFLAAMLLSIFIAFVTCYDIIRNIIRKLFKK